MLKRIFQTLLAVAIVSIAIPSVVHADTKATSYTAVVSTPDPATITTNAAFTFPDTGTLDTTYFNSMTCEAAIAGGASRVFTPKCYGEAAGTNLTFTYPTMTVAAAASGRYVFDAALSSATADTNQTDSPAPPCRFMKITAAAAGDGVFSCTLRRR